MHTYLLGRQMIFENLIIVSSSQTVEPISDGFAFTDVDGGTAVAAVGAVALEITPDAPATARLFFFIGWNGFDNGLNA